MWAEKSNRLRLPGDFPLVGLDSATRDLGVYSRNRRKAANGNQTWYDRYASDARDTSHPTEKRQCGLLGCPEQGRWLVARGRRRHSYRQAHRGDWRTVAHSHGETTAINHMRWTCLTGVATEVDDITQGQGTASCTPSQHGRRISSHLRQCHNYFSRLRHHTRMQRPESQTSTREGKEGSLDSEKVAPNATRVRRAPDLQDASSLTSSLSASDPQQQHLGQITCFKHSAPNLKYTRIDQQCYPNREDNL